jgi:hypothetical protein
MSKGLKITLEDLETGEVVTREINGDDYFLVVLGRCSPYHVTAHANGTHVITIKHVQSAGNA